MNYHISIQTNSFLIVVCSCFLNHATIAQNQIGILHDRDGNIYTTKMLADSMRWMTTNLKIKTPESYSYENVEDGDQYGRLYTWKSAQEGCKLLAEGWHLPTNEEWQKMAKFYGGVRDDSNDEGKSSFKELIIGGNAAFDAVYGGSRDSINGSYARVGAHGFYWTSTESDEANAWFYNFGRNGKILNRHADGKKHMAVSVRCIKDMSHKRN